MLVFIIFGSNAQVLKEEAKEYLKIKGFLQKQNVHLKQERKFPLIYTRRLIDSAASNSCGVYIFRIMGDHFANYLYFKSTTGSIEIIDLYEVNHCLKVLLKFFEKNDKLITQTDRIKYTIELMRFIDANRKGAVE